MSNFQQHEADKIVLKLKPHLLKEILTLNGKCVKNCYPMQIYLKKKNLQ